MSRLIEKIFGKDSPGALREIFARPALVGERDAYIGSTPLHFAAHRGMTRVVEALLDAGAELDARETASGTTPLHWAAEAGHVPVARMLIGRGAALEALDEWFALGPLGWTTAVRWAPPFHEDRPRTAALLRSAGAGPDPFTLLCDGDVPGLRALLAREPAAVERRLGYVRERMQPLHFAACDGHAAGIDTLVACGAALDATTDTGLTPLALALRSSHAAIAAALRRLGARDDLACAVVAGEVDVVASLLRGHTLTSAERGLLFVAARRGHAEIASLLIEAGADVHATLQRLGGERPAPMTALHLAAAQGHLDAASVLLRAGSDPNVGALEGTPTPLHLAAADGQLATVELLLLHGADVGAVESGFCSTPLAWAEQTGDEAVVTRLKAAATFN